MFILAEWQVYFVNGQLHIVHQHVAVKEQLECGPMLNVMVAVLNICGALCSTLQCLADAQYWSAVQ